MDKRVIRLKKEGDKLIGQEVYFLPAFGPDGKTMFREYEIVKEDKSSSTFVPESLQEGDYLLDDFEDVPIMADVVQAGQEIETYKGPFLKVFVGSNREPLPKKEERA
ncbi:hypothetical protein ACXYMU_19060 [Pontibacter sp. CAU 1760]